MSLLTRLVPVLDKADEALQLGRSVPQEVSLQLREAGGKLALFPSGLALLDKLDVDFWVGFVARGPLTQGIKGGQDIKLHLLLELGELSTKLRARGFSRRGLWTSNVTLNFCSL